MGASDAIGADAVQPAEDVWTQLIGRRDLEQAVAAAMPTAGGTGLPWSPGDSWPLSERQLKLLSFELLLLCPPDELPCDEPPEEPPRDGPGPDPPPGGPPAVSLEQLTDAQREQLAALLSERLAR